MKYSVLWSPAAEQSLAQLWNDSADRDVVAHAANEIDARLTRDPEKEGESRDLDRRFLFVSPLCVLFRVYPADRLVHVLTVWRYHKRGRKV